MQYSHLLQLETSNAALSFPLNLVPQIGQQICRLIERIISLHSQTQRLEYTGQHYAVVALDFMETYLTSNSL